MKYHAVHCVLYNLCVQLKFAHDIKPTEIMILFFLLVFFCGGSGAENPAAECI